MTIVGVMPAGFGFPIEAEIWKPMAPAFDEKYRGHHSSYGIGRLKPGVAVETAHAEIETISAALSREHPRPIMALRAS